MGAESRPTGHRLLLIGGLCLFVLMTLAYGAWRGFPVQDDTYMIRLLRLGGPDRILAEHRDRPVFGTLLSAGARLAGEQKAAYIAVGLLAWLLFAGLVGRLWSRLFPEWSFAWPAVALAAVAPVVVSVQYSTLTIVIPCLMPVMLVLAGLLLVLRTEDAPGPGAVASVILLCACAAGVSEYGLAAAAGAVALLMMMGRRRAALLFVAGAAVGYAAFYATARLTVRLETNPAHQFEGLFSRPWTRPFRVVSAAWGCIAGSWGRAASDIHVDWTSKTTVAAAAAGLVAAALVGALCRRAGDGMPARAGRRLLWLVVAVLAALFPAIAIQGWPLELEFETRFLIPALPFATCATIALVLSGARPRWALALLTVVAFLCGDRLLFKAIEAGRGQDSLDRVGRMMQPYVGDRSGIVVLVAPDRTGQSQEEVMAKATYGWAFPQAGRLWVLRPEEALPRFGPRSGCRDAGTLILRRESVRWPHAAEPIRLVLWDAGDWRDFDPEPYYRGCQPLDAHARP